MKRTQNQGTQETVNPIVEEVMNPVVEETETPGIDEQITQITEELGKVGTVSRTKIMRELFKRGNPRSVIAEMFSTSYQVVYQATQGLVQEAVKVESRANVIRRMFNEGMSRADIARTLDTRYQVVYQTTAHLTNEHHNGETHGRSILITDDDGKTIITRRDYMRREYTNGRTRGELAKQFGVPFQTVYQTTKDLGNREKVKPTK